MHGLNTNVLATPLNRNVGGVGDVVNMCGLAAVLAECETNPECNLGTYDAIDPCRVV